MSLVGYFPFDIMYTLCRWMDKRTLITLSTVNRQLYLAAVGFIWAHVTLSRRGYSWAPFDGMTATLIHSPHLAEKIKWLQINIGESFNPSESEANALRGRIANAIEVLRLATGLNRLDLHLNSAREFGQNFYRELAMNAFSFELVECCVPGPYAPPYREFLPFLRAMTSLKSLTMYGIRDQERGWSNYRPDPNDWPLLQSIHCSEIESIAPFIPGRLVRKITVWSLGSHSPRLQTLISEPVESVETFKMQAWESAHNKGGADALAQYLSNLHDVFPRISTLQTGDWHMVGPDDGDGSERIPPLFTDDTFDAVGRFEHLRTIVCPIWAKEGETKTEKYSAESILSSLSKNCPSLQEAFLRVNLFSSFGSDIYEHWSRSVSNHSSALEWNKKEWGSHQALAEYVEGL